MDKQPGFYKNENGDWIYASTKVIFPDTSEILVENYQDYEYPINGWEYYEYPPQEYIDYINKLNLELIS